MGSAGASSFKGFAVSGVTFRTSSFDCKACANQCEVVQFWAGRAVVARWGDRCGKWSQGGGRDLPGAAAGAGLSEPASSRTAAW